MNYIFKGRLSAYLCNECTESLSGVRVLLYRIADISTETVARAAADVKDTFHQVKDSELQSKKKLLLAETVADDDGNFSITLDEKSGYRGEAFDIDFSCGSVPHSKLPPKKEQVLQFHLTTLQPSWRQSGDQNIASWNYSITARWWCYIRQLFNAWVICGTVTDCKTKLPLQGVKVSAFDVDLIQDDPLGSGITDINGHFRIDYTLEDFSKTIFSWLNVEWPAGPDIYFSIATTGGVVLLQENRQRGHDNDRTNRGPCFCVNLCVDSSNIPGGGDPQPLPYFERIGGYNYATDINSTPAGNGLTIGDSRAFFSTLRLNGIAAKKFNNQPMEYMFEYAALDPVTRLPVSGWTQVLPNQIARTWIGTLQKMQEVLLPVPHLVSNDKPYYVNGLAGELSATFTADNWIQMPQQNDNPLNTAGVGLFVPSNNLINLISGSLGVFDTVDCTGMKAGDAADGGGRALAKDYYFGLRMWVREAGNNASKLIAGQCDNVAICNDGYNNIQHHPSWGGYTDPVGTLAINMVDVEELNANGCAGVSTTLHIDYSAAHPNLGSVNINLKGGAVNANFSPSMPHPYDKHGIATLADFGIAALSPCAYLITLSSQLLLTTGDGIPDNLYDQIAFCKK